MSEIDLIEVIQRSEKQNIKSLDLRANCLSELPPEIGSLQSLQSLSLRSNELKSLPPEIGQLSNLESLSLSYNKLNELPAEIGQLKKLKFLNLNSNELKSLPAEIGQLSKLESLSLSYNRLNELPAEIGQLKKLKSLSIRYTLLIELPSEIGQLSKLCSLYISYTNLNRLPAEIGFLSQLSSLDLRANKLTSIPSEIGFLSQLSSLDLSANKLISIPSEIGQLSKLVSFNLSSNQLSEVPAEIGHLTNLVYLDLRENQLTQLSPEIESYIIEPNRTAKQITNYFRQILEQDTERLYEAKLLIVGEGSAGKTTLAKKIENNQYQLSSHEGSTEGIDVIAWKFPFKEGKEFRVNIWDFGGQEIYHATHQFFLTKRSLYVLVADNRKEDTDFYYWLNVVDLLSETSPVLIVKNEKQGRKREINERELRGEFLNLKEVLGANLATNHGFSKIQETIQQYIASLPHVGTELPKAWVKVREVLENTPRNYIDLEEYIHICEENGFTRREDALQLSSYLHDIGVCLHFQKDSLLSRIVILKPTWGTDAVYKVLDNPQVIANLGRFDLESLTSIWCEDRFVRMYPELLRLMIKFKLCYEIPGDPNTYIAPQLLSPNKPEYIWQDKDNLLLRYVYDFMPKGILSRFIVEMHPWIENQTYVWKTGVVLNKDGVRAEVRELYHRKEIHIRISGIHRRDLLTSIRHELDKIHNSYERLSFNMLVPCNCSNCIGTQNPYFYPFKKLQERVANKKTTIECGNPPYHDMDISSLIDDVSRQSSSIGSQVFISYSHEDELWLNQLQTQLKPLIRNQSITVWSDTKISPGTEWRTEIDNALALAKIAILMVSPSFLASDFIANHELPKILDASEQRGLTIIWIPISYSLYEETIIEKYQAVHSPKQPLDSLSSSQQNKALVDICKEIKAILNSN